MTEERSETSTRPIPTLRDVEHLPHGAGHPWKGVAAHFLWGHRHRAVGQGMPQGLSKLCSACYGRGEFSGLVYAAYDTIWRPVVGRLVPESRINSTTRSTREQARSALKHWYCQLTDVSPMPLVALSVMLRVYPAVEFVHQLRRGTNPAPLILTAVAATQRAPRPSPIGHRYETDVVMGCPVLPCIIVSMSWCHCSYCCRCSLQPRSF